ncbi:hypothetical protein [Paenibacillus hexagrammi]|uniref:Phosphoglycerol transferase n=1 Tax=Paenibacillus hexagrammi TaxID=2908839 RepID=A0ABY3SBC1_9BACL|nr:hypothetical protein [Paenibacillus sp. YPD9-1]UJF31282.1 hypothetical protein L0M14_15555 [Paenibacillus sp. YPD9-1]
MKAIGAPYYPWDLVFNNQIVEYRSFLSQYVTSSIVISVLAFLLILALLFHVLLRKHPIRLHWGERSAYAIIALLLLSSLYTDTPIPLTAMNGIYTVPWDQTITYDENGFLLSSLEMLPLLKVDKPSGYSKKAVESIVNQIPETKPSGGKQPNIIVMLSESFMDPTVMKNLTFSEDPIPFLHSLQKTYTSGWMLSPSLEAVQLMWNSKCSPVTQCDSSGNHRIKSCRISNI